MALCKQNKLCWRRTQNILSWPNKWEGSEHWTLPNWTLPDLVLYRIVEEVGPVGVRLHEAPLKQLLQAQSQHSCTNLHTKRKFLFFLHNFVCITHSLCLWSNSADVALSHYVHSEGFFSSRVNVTEFKNKMAQDHSNFRSNQPELRKVTLNKR